MAGDLLCICCTNKIRCTAVFYAATCTSITVSGVGDLDGTFSEAPGSTEDSTWDYYARRLGGTDLFEVYRNDDQWYIGNGDNTVQYSVSHCGTLSEVGALPQAVDAVVAPRLCR